MATAQADAQARQAQYAAIVALIAMMASSKTFKKEIEEFDYTTTYDMLKNSKLYTWKYKNEDDNIRKHIGLIAEEAPEEIVTTDGKHLDTISYLGVLTGAIRTLIEKVEKMEKKNGGG